LNGDEVDANNTSSKSPLSARAASMAIVIESSSQRATDFSPPIDVNPVAFAILSLFSLQTGK
jgi:hypothetical protein